MDLKIIYLTHGLNIEFMSHYLAHGLLGGWVGVWVVGGAGGSYNTHHIGFVADVHVTEFRDVEFILTKSLHVFWFMVVQVLASKTLYTQVMRQPEM